jgi:Methyltransferase domain
MSLRQRTRAAVVRFLAAQPRWARRLLTLAGEAQPRYPVVLDYPLEARRRWVEGRPHPELQAMLAAGDERYAEVVRQIVALKSALSRIAREPDGTQAPCWNNGWQPPLDAAALYTMVATHKPATYLEVGSGHSTRFVRRAIADGKLATRVVSIDPDPRVEVAADEQIRQPLESCDLQLFARLGAGDILFIDGSHRSFMNSDVTVLLLEVLPRLGPDVLVHLHDIFLPYDYPPEFHRWYFNEQYLLASYLLGGARPFEVVLPNYYVTQHEKLRALVAPALEGLPVEGWGFWLRTRKW